MSHPSPTAAMPAAEIVQVTHAAKDDPRIALASTAAAGVWIEIHDGLPSVEALWRSFEEKADCTVFQRFDYLAAWQRHIGRLHNTRPLIVAIRGHGEEILCVLPLVLERKTLRWLGQDNSDYCAPLLAKDFGQRINAAAFALLWDELCEALEREPDLRFDLISLRKMPETIGGQRNPMLSLDTLPNPSNAHLMKMWGEWETFYSEKRSSATRRRDRTKLKKLGEFGEVRMVTPDSEAEIRKTFEGLVEQKSAALARMGVHNIFADPGVQDFYRDLAINARSFVHVSKLQIGTCQASTNLGFEHRGRYYYVFASYDAGETSRFGAGAAHLRKLMQRAMARGLHEFDFTIGDERYKSEWSDTELRLFDYVAARSLRGMLPALVQRLELRLRRAIKQNGRLWSFVLKSRAWMGRFRGGSAAPDSNK